MRGDCQRRFPGDPDADTVARPPMRWGPLMMVLAMDLIVFGSLIVIVVTGGRDGRMSFAVLGTVGMGLVKTR